MDFFLWKVGDSQSWKNRIDVKFLRFMKMRFLFFFGVGVKNLDLEDSTGYLGTVWWSMQELYTGRWLQTFFVFTLNLGEMIQFWANIFRRGWNHPVRSWVWGVPGIWRLKPLERSVRCHLSHEKGPGLVGLNRGLYRGIFHIWLIGGSDSFDPLLKKDYYLGVIPNRETQVPRNPRMSQEFSFTG